MAADLAILMMGPNWTSYYVFTIFNFLHSVGIFTNTWVAFSVTFGDPKKLSADYNVEWSEAAAGTLFNYFMGGAYIVASF